MYTRLCLVASACFVCVVHSLKLNVNATKLAPCPGYEYYGSVLSCGGKTFLLTRLEGRAGKVERSGWTTYVRSLSKSTNYSSEKFTLVEHALSHNMGGVCSNGEVYLIGGQYREWDEYRGYEHYQGVYLSKTSPRSPQAFASMSKPRKIFDGRHPGCFEARDGTGQGQMDFDGACEFDGKMSVVKWKGRFYLFARANSPERHVQVTSTSDFQDWSTFSLIDIEGVNIHNHIYFLHAEVWNSSHMIGFFPGELIQSNDTRSGVFATFSRDAFHWTRPVLVYKQPAFAHHVRTHPAGLIDNRLVLMNACTTVSEAFMMSQPITDSNLRADATSWIGGANDPSSQHPRELHFMPAWESLES